ncbi:MAG: DUF3149 domain-containing protein [Gammaproteobacteria bacterium]|nr:DUF3149 domain-containing protein [Gammaproteobacteria bacterium]
MDLWMNLLFGNPIGLASMIVVLTTFAIISYITVMFISKSGKHHH